MEQITRTYTEKAEQACDKYIIIQGLFVEKHEGDKNFDFSPIAEDLIDLLEKQNADS